MNKPHHLLSMSTLAAAVSVSLIAASALAQSGLPYTIEAPQGSRYFGSRVASGGDANNDGYDDIFVVDDGAEENGEQLGRWYMYSGVDRTLMWSGMGSEPSLLPTHFRVEFLDDVDGDHCDDVILGRSRLLEAQGGVDVFSGRTGELIYSYRGMNPDDRMGRCVSGLGDLDHDDVPDFAFSSRYRLAGQVSIRSGRDGSEIRTIEIEWPTQVRDAGDIDGDLIEDVAIGSHSGEQLEHAIRITSGADGSTIWEVIRHTFDEPNFGYQLAGGIDVTQDDVPDLLTSANFSRERAYLLSGATGEIVTTFTDDDPFHRLQLIGINLEFADLTGDGHAEAVIGAAERNLICHPLTGKILSIRSKYEQRFEYSGTELAAADVNSDGLADLIVGLTNPHVVGVGVVQVTSGGRLLLRQLNAGEYPRDTVRQGVVEEFQVYSGAANRPIRLLASLQGHDCTFVPQLGICIDLSRRIHDLGSATTDAEGFAVFPVPILWRAPLGPMWMQAVDINDPTRGPITSNVMEMEIID